MTDQPGSDVATATFGDIAEGMAVADDEDDLASSESDGESGRRRRSPTRRAKLNPGKRAKELARKRAREGKVLKETKITLT